MTTCKDLTAPFSARDDQMIEENNEHERIRLMRVDSVRMLTAVLVHISDITIERKKNIAG